MKIVEYAKAHPWMTGIVVIVGGIVFISMIGIGGGGGSTQVVDAGPSDAEVMANAQIAAAQIAANSQTGAAQIGAGMQMNSDNLAAQVALRNLDVQEKLGLAQIGGEKDVALAVIGGQTEAAKATIAGKQSQFDSLLASLGKLKKKNRDDVIQAYVTGQPYHAGGGANDVAQIIGSIGGAAKSIGSVIPFL